MKVTYTTTVNVYPKYFIISPYFQTFLGLTVERELTKPTIHRQERRKNVPAESPRETNRMGSQCCPYQALDMHVSNSSV